MSREGGWIPPPPGYDPEADPGTIRSRAARLHLLTHAVTRADVPVIVCACGWDTDAGPGALTRYREHIEQTNEGTT